MNILLIVIIILILITLFLLYQNRYENIENTSENTIETFENDNIVHVCSPTFVSSWGTASPFNNPQGDYINVCSYVDKKTGAGIDVSNITTAMLQIPKVTPVSIAVPQKAAEEFAKSTDLQKQILENLGASPELQKKMLAISPGLQQTIQ
jgi:hypothetical protein